MQGLCFEFYLQVNECASGGPGSVSYCRERFKEQSAAGAIPATFSSRGDTVRAR